MPGKLKIEVPYERVETKLPLGLYKRMEAALKTEQSWPSRQDFIIDAVREKLERLDPGRQPKGAQHHESGPKAVRHRPAA